MRKIASFLLFLSLTLIPFSAFAILSMELTRGVAGAVPIAVVPFTVQGETPPQDIASVVAHDLKNSGRFKVIVPDVTKVDKDYYRRVGADNIVIGIVKSLGNDRYQVWFELVEAFEKSKSAALLTKKYTVSGRDLRSVSHRISDLVYQQLIGVRGIFSTKLAYVVVQRSPNAPTRYLLEVSDQDGYNPRPLLTSPDPIMSPSWSPNGKQIAYVSFEKRHASIFIEDVATGSRHLLSEFPGINGAPAWSPDGRKLALVLSKSGSPNIYLMDIATHQLTQLTHDWYINTEPAWSPDGGSLLFTSNRSGSHPQIYQMNLRSNAISRVSYDGDYNARASFTRDGQKIGFIHRTSGIYKIAILDLDRGTTRVLSRAGDSASPSMAPNGSMILYDTLYGGHNVLAMVSSDGGIELRLPARNGEAQDPAWSPFLS